MFFVLFILTGKLGGTNKNDFGTAVDITSYNSKTNLYTFPCDGYVELLSEYGSSNYGNLDLYGSKNTTPYHVHSNGNNISSGIIMVFVKKGMRCCVGGNAVSSARFIPLI